MRASSWAEPANSRPANSCPANSRLEPGEFDFAHRPLTARVRAAPTAPRTRCSTLMSTRCSTSRVCRNSARSSSSTRRPDR
eukprot:scaffold77959_cov64-Phaeocystis_antarctica.AAC.12